MNIAVRFLIVVVVVLGGSVALGPAVASTGWGKSIALKVASKMSGYQIQAAKLDLSWFGSQEIEDLIVSDQFTCKKITSDAGLWKIWREKDVGHAAFQAPDLKLQQAPPQQVAYTAGFVPAVVFQGALPYQGEIQVSQGSVKFGSGSLSNIEMLLNLGSTPSVRATGATSQDGVVGSFDVDAHLKGSDIDAVIHAKNFPVKSLDDISKMEGKLLAMMGNTLNVDAAIHLAQDTVEASITALSPTFSAEVETQTQNDIVTLKSPAQIHFPLFSLQVSTFSLPLADKEAFSFQATVQTQEFHLPQITVAPIKATLSTDNFKERKFLAAFTSAQVSSSQIEFTYRDGFLLSSPITLGGEVVGTISSLKIPSNWEKAEAEAVFSLPIPQVTASAKMRLSVKTLETISLNVAAQEGTLNLLAALRNKGSLFVMKQPMKAVWTVANLPFVEKPTTVQVQVDPVSFPLIGGLADLKLRGTLSSDELFLKGMTIQNFTAAFQGDRRAEILALQAKGSLGQGELSAILDIKPQMVIAAKGFGKQVPTQIYDKLTSIFGPTVDFTFDLKSSAEAQTLALQTANSLLNVDLSLKQTAGQIELTKPGKALYTLTPQVYETETLSLAKPAQMSLALSALKLPIVQTDNRLPVLLFDPSKIEVQGSLSIPEISLLEKNTGAITTMNNFSIKIGQSSGKAPLSFQMSGAAGPQGKLTAEGSFDHPTGAIALKTQLTQFPTSVFDLFGNNTASALFGSAINASAGLQLQNWTGPVSLNINTSTSRASLAGMLTNGTLTLSDPIYAQVQMTPELSRLVLKGGGAFSAIRANNPLTIEVAPQGFSLPLRPFARNQIQIPNLRIELGQIFCENKGNLNKTIGILKLTELSREKSLKLWFTPIDLHIRNGIALCERTDILVADAYHICSWGNIDFVRQYVDMILGLTASVLKQAFGVKDLPADYVLQIPMQGPFDNVELSTGGATAKVGALLLWQQKAVAGKFGGGLFGEVLKNLGPLPDFDSKAPPPKRPFPWESPAEEPHEKKKKKRTSDAKKHIHPNDKPLDQVLHFLR